MYPFTDASGQQVEQYVDLEDWTHAVASLITSMPRYSPNKETEWNDFLSFAVPSDTPIFNKDDDWHPQSLLEKVTMIAQSQLPLSPKFAPPSIAEIRPRVQKIIDEDYVEPLAGDFAIPYQDMRALVGAILQVVKDNTRDRQFDEDQQWPSLSSDIDRDVQYTVAKGILNVLGVSENEPLSFDVYFAFCGTLVSLIIPIKDGGSKLIKAS